MSAVRKHSVAGYDHVYQITVDRGICFYTTADCIVWFTLLCVLARRYHVRILSVCIMLNHFHIQLKAPSAAALSAFMRDLTSLFTRLYNRQYGLSGPLVGGQFKNAVKQKGQKVRENFIYICNNPIVKHAVPRAEQYRWNFLAYMKSSHPFSEEILPGTESELLVQVLSNVRTRKNSGRPIDYLFFGGLYSRLEEREKRQVIDYIVSEYNVLDYETIRREWGDYEKICQVLSTVAGTEYDIAEEKAPEDYRHYYWMIRLAAREGYDLSMVRLTGIGLDALNRLACVFREEAGATRTEIAKFLHAPFLR